MQEGDFQPPKDSRPMDRLFVKLEIYNYFPDTTPHAKFQGLRRRGWSGQIASLTHQSFCPFFRSFATATGRISGPPPHAQYAIIRRSGQGSAFWGLQRWNLKFDPFYPKNVKIWTLSWRSMENCNRPNSKTVSHIQFKLGIRNDHPSGITWHDSKVKRSKVKVTTSRNVSDKKLQ